MAPGPDARNGSDDGVEAMGGLTTHDEVEAHTNAALIARARTVVVVADSSKMGRYPTSRASPVSTGGGGYRVSGCRLARRRHSVGLMCVSTLNRVAK